MTYWQIKLISIFVFLGFGIAIFKLYNLQIRHGREYRLRAEENRLKTITLLAPRGRVYDRNGNVIAANQPVYRLAKEDDRIINRTEALKIQAEGTDQVVIEPRRDYPFGSAAAHLVGYLGPVDLNELVVEKLQLKGYDPAALIGRSGVEAQYENMLKGHNGSRLVEVDTGGKVKRLVSELLASPGKSLTLAVDLRLQQTAEQQMNGKKGAVIALDPKTGEILVLYSAPSFDPNVLTLGKDWQTIGQWLISADQPLFDRTIAGRYPPGSTFKLVTASAGLAEGKITPSTTVNDTGIIRVGDFSYTNWFWTGYGRTEGEISLAKALSRSTDTYFYKVGEWVGEKKLIEWAKKFGLDKKFDVDLPGEISGFIATPEWKMENRGEPWFLGNTYHVSIGQGDLSLTPLGVVMMTSVFANNGKYCQPRVLKIGAENTPYQANCIEVGLDLEYLKPIRQGMVMACSEGGTGWPLFGFKPSVACKTGTSETGEDGVTHAWFTAYAPVDDPSIVITVLVENGGEGSSVAGPIAKELLKVWFENTK